VVGVAAIAGFLGLLASFIAVFYLHTLLWSPLSHLSRSVRTIANSRDHFGSIPTVGAPIIDSIATDINRLVDAIKQRDETIDRHELMERNLDEWLKRRSTYELELQQARAVAEDANTTKTQFLASVSHELRTPLHTIMSYARFGERDVAAGRFDDIAEYFEVILDSSDLLLLLLNDLLDLSKLESGKMSFNPMPSSFGDIVGCVADQFQVDLKEKNLEVVLDLREPDMIFVDPTRTLQVVRNLFENAIKYTKPNTSIFVSVSKTGDNVTLCVRDQGEGVPQDELDLIFESFKQSSKTGDEAGGVGLGLAISRQIVSFQKGRIWVENHAEGGLAVFVQFAACYAERPAEKPIGHVART
jgi:signal transduction histidine kinase